MHPTARATEATCILCRGAVTFKNDGSPWDRCYQCKQYSDALDLMIPISYSTANGLESALHRYKDWPNYSWLGMPLACLLHTFLSKHSSCIEGAAGSIDIAILVPPNTPTRTFGPVENLLSTVTTPTVQQWYNWQIDALVRDTSHPRPGRGSFSPEAYLVNDRVVRDKTVLLLDDTWTSGASMASSAGALKAAGAKAVVGLTLGRQLNLNAKYGNTSELYEQSNERAWDQDECTVCAG